jgi:hypothetical protein
MSKHKEQQHESTEPGGNGAAQVGTVVGQRSMAAAKNARIASDAIAASHPVQVAGAASRAEFITRRAGEIADSAAKAAANGSRSGAFEQVKGHFIEAATIDRYNAAGKLVGKKLVTPNSHTHKAYDAMRIVGKGADQKFTGAVQIKSSSHGVEKAISQIEKVKPGSARNATLMVSQDEVGKSTAKAAGRIRVRGNGVTRAHATNQLEEGVNGLAKKGTSAASSARALGKAGAVGAVAGAAIGGVAEAGALKRGEISKRHYLENRAVDAGEGATGAVLGTGAASLAATGATAVMGTAAGASATASIGAAGTAVVGSIGGMGSAGAAVAGALGTVTAPVAIPVVVGGAASIAVGIGVSKAAKRIRRKVDASRAESAAEARTVPTARPSVARKQARLRVLCSERENRVRLGRVETTEADTLAQRIASLEAEIAALEPMR